MLGGLQSNRAQQSAWKREEYSRLRAERRAVYVRFITAARAWRAYILSPDSQIKEAATTRRIAYSDGGPAFEETVRALTEIRIIAFSSKTIEAADHYDRTIRELARVKASIHPRLVPEEVHAAYIAAEATFIQAARDELS
ncbi:hypothetical protein FDG2_2019 [Candidatus Protofrankia californiensis]|uniref:Uncharacterized protein n=1 Tax=Candidatus Protofrankia californiensis TaxID=1839754 RepID=A0A1C3NWR1_9ACTN|nr:hypothetical protein FDG2_2019 [Candidatus Protofrankia californiensis]